MRSRLAAWLVTGPLGHFWAGAADWLALLSGWALGRVRRRWRSARGRGGAASGPAR